MAQGDPPVYQLVDSNGNVQAEIRHDLAQSLIIDQLNGSDIDFQSSDLSNIASVSTDALDAGLADPDGGDVTANRSFGVEYQNTTGNLLAVSVQINADDVVPDVTFAKDSTTGLGSADDIERFTFRGIAGSGYQILGTVGGLVPDGHYYTARQGTDNNAEVLEWKETEFQR